MKITHFIQQPTKLYLDLSKIPEKCYHMILYDNVTKNYHLHLAYDKGLRKFKLILGNFKVPLHHHLHRVCILASMEILNNDIKRVQDTVRQIFNAPYINIPVKYKHTEMYYYENVFPQFYTSMVADLIDLFYKCASCLNFAVTLSYPSIYDNELQLFYAKIDGPALFYKDFATARFDDKTGNWRYKVNNDFSERACQQRFLKNTENYLTPQTK